jgi:hypothetical protein
VVRESSLCGRAYYCISIRGVLGLCIVRKIVERKRKRREDFGLQVFTPGMSWERRVAYGGERAI